MPICKLCGEEKPLIKAHIFPDWGFRFLKEENHLIMLDSNLKDRKLQSGFWDTNILCADCDGVTIGKLDTYAKRFFGQDFSLLIQIFTESGRKSEKTYHIKDFDFDKLFLFLVSLLWRASVTELPSFKNTKLGKYEEVAKQMIISGVPTHENIFEIVVFAAEAPALGQKFEKSIALPMRAKFGVANCYRFVFGGFDFVFKVDQRKSDIHFSGFRIERDGFHIILIPFENSTMGKLVKNFKEKFREERSKT